MMAMVNPNAQAYAQNIALQAEIQGIREEMQKQAKQAQIAQEVQNRIITANTNPRTEIIRELQTIIQPTVPLPQAPPQHSELMTAFEQAMANQNHAGENGHEHGGVRGAYEKERPQPYGRCRSHRFWATTSSTPTCSSN